MDNFYTAQEFVKMNVKFIIQNLKLSNGGLQILSDDDISTFSRLSQPSTQKHEHRK